MTNEWEGEEHIQSVNKDGDFVLTESGFFRTDNPRAGGGGAPSDVTYSTIIDPLKGSHEQIYSMARQIPPGDIERFHIMVGAPMSCHLLIQFQIFVDKTVVLKSEIFNIDIWNPRNSRWHFAYKDGEELKRDIDEKQKLLNTGHLSEQYKDEQQFVLKYLKYLASIYPFIDERNQTGQ